MAQVIIKEEHLTDIANAIRTQNKNSTAIYTPMQMAPAILNLFISGTPVKHLQSIKMINQPVYQFIIGEKFSLEGLQVQAIYDDGSMTDVTNDVTSNIQVGTRLLTESDIEVILTYSENGITKSISYTAYVTDILIVKWSDGTNQQISDMIAAADAGRIDLRRYWTLGDIRIPFRDPIFPSDPPEYPQTERLPYRALVLADYGDNYKLTTPIGNKTHGNFLVQYQYIWDTIVAAQILGNIKDMEPGPKDEFIDNSGNIYLYSGTYKYSALDNYCNGSGSGDTDADTDYIFVNDQLEFIKQNVKYVQVPILKKYNSSEIEYISRKYFLPTETEIFGRPIHSHPAEATVTKQWTIYKINSESKIKYKKSGYQGGPDEVDEYWTRSPLVFTGDQSGSNASGWYICAVSKKGEATAFSIEGSPREGVAPAFII